MKIDGRLLARTITTQLEKDVEFLLNKNIVPHLFIILVGSDPASKSYIRQKIKKAGEIGIRVTLKQFPKNTSEKTLLRFVDAQNNDRTVHGVIIQRPLPQQIDPETIKKAVTPEKDVDGFHPDSKFDPPLALAVMRILSYIFSMSSRAKSRDLFGFFQKKENLKMHGTVEITEDFKIWLSTKNIVFLGRGEAGGKPVFHFVEKLNVQHHIIHSQTENPEEILKKADIIISAVGKNHVVRGEIIKKGVILIGIGLHKENDGKLHGDYEEDEVKNIAAFYTPTPGGVGPMNVAMLLSNVVRATQPK